MNTPNSMWLCGCQNVVYEDHAPGRKPQPMPQQSTRNGIANYVADSPWLISALQLRLLLLTPSQRTHWSNWVVLESPAR